LNGQYTRKGYTATIGNHIYEYNYGQYKILLHDIPGQEIFQQQRRRPEIDGALYFLDNKEESNNSRYALRKIATIPIITVITKWDIPQTRRNHSNRLLNDPDNVIPISNKTQENIQKPVELLIDKIEYYSIFGYVMK
jgi:signal recognition particle receptor subunit beta